MTRQTALPDGYRPQMDVEYRFSPTQNDGRITPMKDWISGEEVTYQYDSLNRLISAVMTGPEWGLSFQYDGFGNLTNQTLTKGSAPTLAVAVDPPTNRILGSGFTYDANGNITATSTQTFGYDVANRAVNASGTAYRYDPFNRKVYGRASFGGYLENCLHLYGPNGELIGDFALKGADPGIEAHVEGREYVYFAGHRISVEYEGDAHVDVNDRLGSTRIAWAPNLFRYQASSYYPYGETRTGQGPMFATYPGDGLASPRYAMNRWYSSQIGRFTTPDPYRASASLANPQSWNRYAYVENDPVNFNDPSGLNRRSPSDRYRQCLEGHVLTIRGCNELFWMYEEDGGGGGGRFSPGDESGGGGGLSAWGMELRNLNVWKQSLRNALTRGLPDDCNNALGLLNGVESTSRAGQPPISAAGLMQALDRSEFRNGAGSPDLFMANLFPGRIAPNESMAKYTVGDEFADRKGVNAMGALGGNLVYFRPGGSSDSATIMHELLHNLGLEDDQIMSALNLTGATVEISRFLWDKCLKPDVAILW